MTEDRPSLFTHPLFPLLDRLLIDCDPITHGGRVRAIREIIRLMEEWCGKNDKTGMEK